MTLACRAPEILPDQCALILPPSAQTSQSTALVTFPSVRSTSNSQPSSKHSTPQVQAVKQSKHLGMSLRIIQ
jgi:hypothetical protein